MYCINEKESHKHIVLAESVHHLTRSKHLITILNKLGHCISYKYKALKNLDTEIIRAILHEDEDKKIILPKNIVRNSSLFLHGAIDKDFNEETLSGEILHM